MSELKFLRNATSASSPSPTSTSVGNVAAVTPQQPAQEEPVKDVLDKINPYIKSDVFRILKFIRNAKEMEKACKILWDDLHAEFDNEIDLETFSRIYASAIKSKLSSCRQYNQQRGKAAALGKCFC